MQKRERARERDTEERESERERYVQRESFEVMRNSSKNKKRDTEREF
jgi:hypothetical protein